MAAKYVRFKTENDSSPRYGQIVGNEIEIFDSPPWRTAKSIDKIPMDQSVRLLAPVEPSKIVCIGLNYHAHVKASYSADEAPDRPLIFLKPPSSIIGPGDTIIHTNQSGRVDYEAELGVVIGKEASHVDENSALDYIIGYTCVNDVTARDLQKIDGQWSRAKGFDTFCPVGPWIVTDVDYRDLLVEGILNDEIKQSGRTAQMIFQIPFLISYISSVMRLLPGDLIVTGTPSGIAPMVPGDKIEVRIQEVGSLINVVGAF